MTTPEISRLQLPAKEADVGALGDLLSAVVESGEAVSFLSPLSLEAAEDWWRQTLRAPGAVFLVARVAEKIVGTVRLHSAWPPNQPHRAEVVKLLVHRDHRRCGLGTRLMLAVEEVALEAGLSLLTLDAKAGGAAEVLYRRLGWLLGGMIPRFALDPDGVTLHDAVILYKELKIG